MKNKMKLTKLEKGWILYDIGNSAFILLVSTLLPIYFNALASGAGISESDYLAYWGYAGSVATILVAILGPICGTMADWNYKKPLFFGKPGFGRHRLCRPGCCLELAVLPGDLRNRQSGL